jgi:hypothetical protein
MKRLLATGLAISAVALFAPRAANAASLTINDALETGILFSVGQFDTGVGFVLDGTQILAPSLGTASALVSEGTPATGPITHTFMGQFFTAGPFVAPTSGVIAFLEGPGGGVSDILTFNYTGGGGSPGAFGVGTLTGSFVSDLDPGGNLVAPPGATFVFEGAPVIFSNTNITASAISDAEVVPEPASLVLFGTGLLGVLRYSRRKR